MAIEQEKQQKGNKLGNLSGDNYFALFMCLLEGVMRQVDTVVEDYDCDEDVTTALRGIVESLDDMRGFFFWLYSR